VCRNLSQSYSIVLATAASQELSGSNSIRARLKRILDVRCRTNLHILFRESDAQLVSCERPAGRPLKQAENLQAETDGINV